MSKFIKVEKNTEDIRKTVLTNVVKMLTERKIYPSESLDTRIKTVLSISSDDMIYEIGKDPVYLCKIINHKISAINKSYGLIDFIEHNASINKIIIVKDINTKVINHVENINGDKTEIFLEKELMINIVEHILVPKHIVLNEEEANEVLETYLIKKSNMPKILVTDPMAKYYNMKAGMVCKIIRPSDKAGQVPFYRYCIKG